ncbi:MAG: TolC family protein [Gemmataceae bacterium]|nr:TolC family protein [Gemmataceae bacterium]
MIVLRRYRLLAALASTVAIAWTGIASAQSQPVSAQPIAADQGKVASYSLDDLIRMSLEANPRLRRAALAVDAAQGRAQQAGLYPNPTLSAGGDEMGSKLGPGGVVSAPVVSQEIVTGRKLRLSEAAALKQVDQATIDLLGEQFTLMTVVRQSYFEVLTAQRRVEVLNELIRIASQSVENTKRLLEAKEVSKLDLLQLQVDLNRFRADQEAAEQEATAAFRRMAANMGLPNLAVAPLIGMLDTPVPDYDFDKARQVMHSVSPRLRSSQVEVQRAQLVLRRAQVEPIPNVTVGAGYVRQNKDRENDWAFQVSVPIPIWNRNQGNIRAAQAGVGQAIQQVSEIENELVGQLATTFGNYAAARKRADRYRTSVLPDAKSSLTLSLEAYKGGQFEYLRVLQAQRSVAEANLEYVRALGDLWRASGEIAGLLLEENWPPAPTNTVLPLPTSTPKPAGGS